MGVTSSKSPPVYRYPTNDTPSTTFHSKSSQPAAAKLEPDDSADCRVCAVENTLPATNRSSNDTSSPSSCPPCYAYSHSSCPLNRAELGRAAWAYLHTLAAYYPSNPSTTHQNRMREFFQTFSASYPCGYCADRTNEELIRNPPRVESQEQLSTWLCEVHNEVNERLNKPTFNCNLVNQRWKTGPETGECD